MSAHAEMIAARKQKREPTEKYCAYCNRTKRAGLFLRRSKRPDCLSNYCTKCTRKSDKRKALSFAANMADCYVRGLIKQSVKGADVEIPAALIEAKRAHLKVVRLVEAQRNDNR